MNGWAGNGVEPTGAPTEFWPQGLIYHGIRALGVLVLAAIVTVLFPPVGETLQRYEVGQVLDEGILAEVPFRIPKSEAELQSERQTAADAVAPRFDLLPQSADTMSLRLTGFFDQLDTVAAGGDAAAVLQFLEGSRVSDDTVHAGLMLDPANRTRLRETSMGAVRELLPAGVLDQVDESRITSGEVAIRVPGAPLRTQDASDVLRQADFYEEVVDRLDDMSLDLAELLRLVTIRHFESSLKFDEASTSEARERARRSVQTDKGEVVVGEWVARGNEQLTQADLDRLTAYQSVISRPDSEGFQIASFVGAGLLHVMLLGVYVVMIALFRTEVYGNLRWLAVQAGLVAVYFLSARVVLTNDFPFELLPVAFVTLSVAVLWDSRMAIILGLVVAAITYSLPGFELPAVLYTTAIGGAAGALSVRVVRRRAQTWVFIAIIAAAYMGVLVSQALLAATSVQNLTTSIVWAGLNAAVSGMIAMGMVPVFEWFTGITTDQTLLEWADPNRALLRRLSMEAPGTYAHTINVANLGEQAAAAIGANGLLCRVGLYYHDIGKVLKPHYFVENQPDGRNPHDKLKPRVSAGIVREHVTEGEKLGREEKLPRVIADFITEHHGSQSIAYFYNRAVEEEGEENVDEADFRYPGPRPRSKETAIAMLADSVESATRVLQDPTPERVRALVEGIVDSKVQDRQLDDAPITLQELATLKESFVKMLSGLYHHRIDYPTTRHLTDAPEDEAAEGEDTEAGDEPNVEGAEVQHHMDLGPEDEDSVA